MVYRPTSFSVTHRSIKELLKVTLKASIALSISCFQACTMDEASTTMTAVGVCSGKMTRVTVLVRDKTGKTIGSTQANCDSDRKYHVDITVNTDKLDGYTVTTEE